MGEPLEIQSSPRSDFSDPVFFQGLFRECLENEVYDKTQWITVVSLCAQTLYGQIMQQNLKLGANLKEDDLDKIQGFVDYSLQERFKKGEITNEDMSQTKEFLEDILDILS